MGALCLDSLTTPDRRSDHAPRPSNPLQNALCPHVMTDPGKGSECTWEHPSCINSAYREGHDRTGALVEGVRNPAAVLPGRLGATIILNVMFLLNVNF